MTTREQQIMDRHDAGIPAPEIAFELKLAESYVRQIINFFSGDNTARTHAAIRSSTQNLGDAIARYFARQRA